MSRAHLLLWMTTGLASAILVALATRASLTIDYASLAPVALLFGPLLLLFVRYTWVRPTPLISALVGTQAALLWGLTMVGMIALAGLGIKAPYIDDSLIKADAALGLSVEASIEWILRWPTILTILGHAYEASVALAIASTIALCLYSRYEDAWTVSMCLVGSGLVCAVVAAYLPALGAFPSLTIPSGTLAGLPSGSGVYHLATVEALRERKVTEISLSMLNGVVTFPSFHAGMAMAIAHTGLRIEKLRFVGVTLAALVMVSTIPIGGHYYVDVLAGIVVYLAFAGVLMGRKVTRPSIAHSAPTAGGLRPATAG